MLWCRKTFQRIFSDDYCRIFPTQNQLFDFLDRKNAQTTDPYPWLAFSIEFPSELEVTRELSRRNSSQKVFKKTSLGEEKSTAQMKRGCVQALREDYSVLYGQVPLSSQNRLFLAATLDGIRLIIDTMDPLQLHLYEVIRESTPCHLYFDVERTSDRNCIEQEINLDSSSSLDQTSNNDVEITNRQQEDVLVATVQDKCGPQTYRFAFSDYNKLLRSTLGVPIQFCPLTCTVFPDETHIQRVLLSELGAFIQKYYPFLLLRDHSEEDSPSLKSIAHTVLVMRSLPIGASTSGAQKFSQHYVINFHRHVFDTNASVGEFVRQFVKYLQLRCGESCEVHQTLFYHGAPVVQSLMARSSSEECARLDVPLIPRRCVIDTAVYTRNRTMRCLGSCKLGKNSVLQLESFVCDGQPVCFEKKSQFDNFMSCLIVAHDWLTPLTTGKRSLFSIEAQTDLVRSRVGRFDVENVRNHTPSMRTAHSVSEIEDVNLRDKIRHLEASYRDVSTSKCEVASLRHASERYVILSLKGTRYCQNVMREHKSNHVYLVVDLVKNTWVQKCHDPECAHYRSEPKPC